MPAEVTTVIEPGRAKADARALPSDRWWVLFLMTAVYTVSIADRFVTSTLIEPIKAAFHLSDAAVGVLTGTALAIFYVGAGIPLGILADRTNRKRMVSLALGLWSVLTIVCGFAGTFWQLFLARVGVGVGEAGGTPPAYSILGDVFPPRQRGFALTVFALGASIGAAMGASLGGWISDAYGWRAVLQAFGALGLPVALLILVGMREPTRGALDLKQPERNAGIRETFAFIGGQKALLHLIAGATVVTFWGWGLIWWTPAFLVRSHHMTVGQSGALLGWMHGIGGSGVTLVTAWIMGLLAHKPPKHQVWFIGGTTLLATIPSIAAFWATDMGIASWMLWLFVPMTYLYIGPSTALIMNLVPANMRAQVGAVTLFTANFANLVLAPTLIGYASDSLAPHLADPTQSLRWVLVTCGFTGVWGAYHYFAAAKDLAKGLVAAGTENAAEGAMA